MNGSKKIKAGAMQYVLVVSVVIAILVFAFISLIHLQQKMTVKHRFSRDAIHNTQLGFDWLKVNNIAYDTETKLHFSETPLTVTTLVKKHWGIFDLGIVQATVKNERFQKAGILGVQNPKRKALVLKDNNQSLVFVGNTKVIGDVLIPKQGIKSGNIGGTSFYGNRYIYGNTGHSSATLPPIKNRTFLKDFAKNISAIDGVPFELSDGLQMQQSFYEKTAIYQANNPIHLSNVSLGGNIIISSKSAIRVAASASLEDIILIAPKISIESDFHGNFQAIASKEIELKKKSVLQYPSALIVLERKSATANPSEKQENQLLVSENSEVRGILLFDSESETANFNAQITIAEKALVKGEVYCSKNTALLGTVYGTVYTHNFLVKKAGGIYINHIYNGVIDAESLHESYAGLQIAKESNTVAKWVD